MSRCKLPLIVALLMLLAPASAAASGGQTIASAPSLAVDTPTMSGWAPPAPSSEYWRVALATGEQLTVDIGAVGTACGANSEHGLTVWDPSVTDFSRPNSISVASFSEDFHADYEVVFTAPYSGNWTLQIYACATYSYELTAHMTPLQGASPVQGGSSIATAPRMPLDSEAVSGWANGNPAGQYWRVPLGARDRLTVDVRAVGSACGANAEHGADIYDPSVTDYTLSGSSPTQSYTEDFHGQYELVFTAPHSGNWTLNIHACATYTYTLSAHVQHPTAVRLNVARRVSAGHRLLVSGVVAGASGGLVKVTVLSSTTHPRPLLLRLSHKNRFSLSIRPSSSGAYRVKAYFYGDRHHLPSFTSRRFEVV